MRGDFDLSVYFVADPSLCGGRPVATVVAAAIAGGVTMVQYRNKLGCDAKEAAEVLEICRAYNVPCLINDHVDLALQIGADGVHIGQGDIKPEEARDALGENAIIGLTAFTPEHFDVLDPTIVDYAGSGPVYETKTDKGKPVIGVEGFGALVALSPVPVVGIGGVSPETAAPIIKAGAQGVAMMRAVSEAERPDLVAAEFVKIVKGERYAA